jgi:hypothetical protein
MFWLCSDVALEIQVACMQVASNAYFIDLLLAGVESKVANIHSCGCCQRLTIGFIAPLKAAISILHASFQLLHCNP